MGGEEVDSILEKFQGAPGDWVPMVWMVVLPLGPLRVIWTSAVPLPLFQLTLPVNQKPRVMGSPSWARISGEDWAAWRVSWKGSVLRTLEKMK